MADKVTVGEAILENVRLSFADLFKPGKAQTNDAGEEVPGKYKANLLMELSGERAEFTARNRAKLKKAGDDAKRAAFGDDISKWPKFKSDRVCVRKGDDENWDGYEDTIYVSANNQNQPVLNDKTKDDNGVDWDVLTLTNGGPKKLYSGAYANVIVRLWVQKPKTITVGGKPINIPLRLNASLEAVQFRKHGKAFGGGAPVNTRGKFDDMIEEDDDDSYGADAVEDDDLI